jgi:hypothetical protein
MARSDGRTKLTHGVSEPNTGSIFIVLLPVGERSVLVANRHARGSSLVIPLHLLATSKPFARSVSRWAGHPAGKYRSYTECMDSSDSGQAIECSTSLSHARSVHTERLFTSDRRRRGPERGPRPDRCRHCHRGKRSNRMSDQPDRVPLDLKSLVRPISWRASRTGQDHVVAGNQRRFPSTAIHQRRRNTNHSTITA